MSSSLDERARALAVAQDFGPEALDLNRRLVAENPNDAGARTRLARCYLQAGRLEDAEAEYREALRLNPQNRIAAGGLETIEAQRRGPDIPAERARVSRPPRAVRAPASSRQSPLSAAPSEPVPASFAGFGPPDFAELASCRRGYVQGRFAPRVIDLVRRVNALSTCVEMAAIREPGKRQLFRTARTDVHPADAHWYVFNLGGRWEPQCNIGMYGGRAVGNWLRVGLGFNLTDEGADRDREEGVAQVRERFRRFQHLLGSPRGSLFLGWMVKEEGRLQCDGGGPRLDIREPSRAASTIVDLDPDRSDWVFFGKWLRLEEPGDAAVLADPVTLVRTIDRVFTGLLPLWRALHEAEVRSPG